MNGPLGLEQGFTLAARPAPRATGPLSLRLRPRRHARLRRRGQRRRLRRGTSGIVALPPGTRPDMRFPASLALSGRSLTLQIDDRGARYPGHDRPVPRAGTLQAADDVAGDELGTSVAVSGDTIVVGAVADDGHPRLGLRVRRARLGLGGRTRRERQADRVGRCLGRCIRHLGGRQRRHDRRRRVGDDGRRGAAYRSSSRPEAGREPRREQQAHGAGAHGRRPVRPLGRRRRRRRGRRGARRDRRSRLRLRRARHGLDRFADPERSPDACSRWSRASSAGLSPIAGGTVAVGAYGGGSSRGAVYVFGKPATGWSGALNESAKLSAAAGAAGDGLGFSVAVSGTIVVAGAPYDDAFSGSAYVFERPGAGWSGSLTESARLRASAGTTSEGLGVSSQSRATSSRRVAGATTPSPAPCTCSRSPAAAGSDARRDRAADGAAAAPATGSAAPSAWMPARSPPGRARTTATAARRASSAPTSGGDLTPPLTTIALTPAGPDGQNGWYRSAVHVTASASDPSGVAELRCFSTRRPLRRPSPTSPRLPLRRRRRAVTTTDPCGLRGGS